MLYDDQREMQQNGYGMPQNIPQPMPGMADSYMPALQGQDLMPSAQQPALPQYRHGGRARYARGGRAKNSQANSLAQLAELMRQEGEYDDKVLAHINPEEAAQLQQQSGAPSRNPQTGLPQYGGLKKFARKNAQIALPILGGVFGGPAGAAAGGALGGLVQGGKKKWKHAAQGAAIGGLGAYGLEAAGGLSGLGAKLGGLGTSMGGIMGGGGGGIPGQETQDQKTQGGGLSGLDQLLIGGGLLGTLLGKRKVAEEPSLAEQMAGSGMNNQGLEYRPTRPMERIQRIIAEDDDENGTAERLYFDDVNPETQYMADGGRYMSGGSGGQDDLVNARLSDGEYVIPADVVSSLGDGNNNAGAKKFDGMLSQIRGHKTSKRSKGLPPRAKKLSSYMRNLK